jgi:hypothetical protein
MTLQELIAILEAAEGPDRKIDRLISVYDPGPKPEISSWNYTDSVDRAIALAEKVLPGWRIQTEHGDNYSIASFVRGWGARREVLGVATSERADDFIALALCESTLRALQAKTGDRT